VKLLWEAAQRVEATVAEAKPGPGNEVAHRARHDGFAWFGEVRNPRRDMDGDATDVVRLQLDLASVQTAPTRWRTKVGTRIVGRIWRASISPFILNTAMVAEGLALSRSRRAM
jgi:hypothetical protein